MRITEYLDKTCSVSRNRTRSATPGLLPQRARPNSTDLENFFHRKTSKIPFDSIPVQDADSGSLEYITQLKLLKTQLNRSKLEWVSIESHLKKAKIDISKIEFSEKEALSRLEYLEKKSEFLQLEKLRVQKFYNFAVVDYNSYLHIKTRMTITSVFMDIRLNNLKDALKSRSQLACEEERKMLKTAEVNGRCIRKYRNFSENYAFEDKRRVLVAQQLDKDIFSKRGLTSKREVMEKRRIEIAEAVANEDKNQRNNFLREGLLLHKSWFKYLNSKLLKETAKSKNIEQAYEKVRSFTGLTNIHEVVQKVLTRENSYLSLMNMITESKKICEKFSKRNSDLEEEMSQILVEEKEVLQGKNEDSQKFLVRMIKKITAEKEKLSRVKAVKSYVATWAKSMLRRFKPGTELPDGKILDLFAILREFIKLKVVKNENITTGKNIFASYPLRKKKIRESTKVESTKMADLMYSEEEVSENMSPNEKISKKRPKSIYK